MSLHDTERAGSGGHLDIAICLLEFVAAKSLRGWPRSVGKCRSRSWRSARRCWFHRMHAERCPRPTIKNERL